MAGWLAGWRRRLANNSISIKVGERVGPAQLTSQPIRSPPTRRPSRRGGDGAVTRAPSWAPLGSGRRARGCEDWAAFVSAWAAAPAPAPAQKYEHFNQGNSCARQRTKRLQLDSRACSFHSHWAPARRPRPDWPLKLDTFHRALGALRSTLGGQFRAARAPVSLLALSAGWLARSLRMWAQLRNRPPAEAPAPHVSQLSADRAIGRAAGLSGCH